ncbi:hypothetical protein K488DRAFT_41686 [Vararia minispora EC-137]|uniref:Uncharacterized protein n=1 Tax=Vararia minispora EC-137 TaxID=1314806 RepID=A0ACB8QWM0_9AGAM|nr:hypothetical protein K488DRAFT_41686 [Vararia minispora EC-137]
MAKGSGKSSASSATRKKHARRAVAGQDDEHPPATAAKSGKKQGKSKDKHGAVEPRKKAYVPPAKPAPVRHDPLDAAGLAHSLPAALVVVLRKVGKKDETTKVKALEELQGEWIERARGVDAEEIEGSLGTMLPVWLHHLPTLLLHPSRRVRLLAASIHAKLFRIPSVCSQLILQLRDIADADTTEAVFGTWALAAQDADRGVAMAARRSLDAHVSLGVSLTEDKLPAPALAPFVQRAIFDPLGLYAYLNPVQVPVNTTPPRIVRGRIVAAPPVRKIVEEPEARPDDEDEDDRRARLRIGGMGTLQWLVARTKAEGEKSLGELGEIFANPTLWTGLAEGVDVLGGGQPLVRAATWRLLHALLQSWKAEIQPLVPMLSVAVLWSAFCEPDVQVRGAMLTPWLTFLKEFPSAWELEAAYRGDEGEDGEEGSEHEHEDASDEPKERIVSSEPSLAFRMFLQFLELGCNGSPLQSYPTILIILSTVPSWVYDPSAPYPYASFLGSFWAAVDGQALSSAFEMQQIAAAFLSALLECTALLARRLRTGVLVHGESGDSAAHALVREQYTRVWEEVSTGRLRVDPVQGATIVAKGLAALEADDAGCFNEAWDALAPALAADVRAPGLQFAKTFHEAFADGTRPRAKADELVRSITASILASARDVLAQDTEGEVLEGRVDALLNLLETFGEALFEDAQLAQDLHDTISNNFYKLAGVSPQVLATYLTLGPDAQLWHNLLSAISSRPALAYTALPPLLEAAERGAFPKDLRPEGQALDGAVARLFEDTEEGRNAKALSLILRIVQHNEHFLSPSSFETLLHLVVSDVCEQCTALLDGEGGSLARLEALLDIVSIVSVSRAHTDLAQALLPDVFLIARLFPRCLDMGESSRGVTIAEAVWNAWVECANETAKESIMSVVQCRLRELICSVTAKPTPHDILLVASATRMNISAILPERTYVDGLASTLNQDPVHPILAITLPLVPPASAFDVVGSTEFPTDTAGFSAYARAVSAWLRAAGADRLLARSHVWMLRHLIILGVLADEFLSVPALQSSVFSNEVDRGTLEAALLRVQQLAAYLLSVPRDGHWHVDVAGAAAGGKADSLDVVGAFVADLVRTASTHDTYRDARVLFDVLQYIIGDASSTEADVWMGLARKLEKTAPQTSLAIVRAIVQSGVEPPRLDRYRNELAADALGIPASAVTDRGLLLLRRLSASAPDSDSDVAFLPAQRAVNFVKAVNGWLASDEDMDEDVESELLGVFVHLVPILQNVQGSHWELMFDLVENAFENSSFDDDMTLVGLWRAIKLAETIREFARYNKALREIWSSRKSSLLKLVKDLVTNEKHESGVAYSEPRSVCREAALSLLQDMPSSLLDHETLPQLTHLLADPSSTVLKISYDLLRAAAAKRTEYFVVEAGVGTEEQVKIELPVELMQFLQKQMVDLADPTNENGSVCFRPLTFHQVTFSSLLGWMLLLDLFENISAKVRTAYVEQLIFLDVVATHLLPTISALLHIGPSGKPFKLDIWAVDDFFVPEADPDNFLSMRLFAAHVYYRALITIPSLVRDWLTTYNDRGTQTIIASYISAFFSPPIVLSEFARIRSAEKGDLEAENFAVKLATAVREVSAVYTVDDQQLELTLKIPSNWPLQRIETGVSRLVGLPESRRRSWQLGVQQIAWSQNGHILDAIVHFKNNVILHFQGQVECPICYAIISASDGSLPKTPCKTCKNRFHSYCLYKWFESSHSSSCPLCRSDIL